MTIRNSLDKCAHNGAATLRYLLIITADPDAQQLTGEEQQAVRKLLRNDDGWHNTFIGATPTEAQHFFAVVKNELTGGS
jgi:hypothetical protein